MKRLLAAMLSLAACAHSSPSTDDQMLSWSQGYPRAAAGLCLWRQRNPLDAPELLRWVRDHPVRAREVLLWGAEQVGRASVGAFYREHPSWQPELVWDAPIGVLLAWAAAEPQAVQELASIPGGLEWAQTRIACEPTAK